MTDKIKELKLEIEKLRLELELAKFLKDTPIYIPPMPQPAMTDIVFPNDWHTTCGTTVILTNDPI